jgi:hypothetical protein
MTPSSSNSSTGVVGGGALIFEIEFLENPGLDATGTWLTDRPRVTVDVYSTLSRYC